MKKIDRAKQALIAYLEKVSLRLSQQQAPLVLCLLGIATGIVSGLVMVAFRLVIMVSPALFLATDYLLSPMWRLLLPIVGGVLLGRWLEKLADGDRDVGVVHLMRHLAYHEGHLPLKNAWVQFLGVAACIGAGHSVGHEGPSAHIGGTSGSWIGQYLRLPNNSIRVLVGCGVAGGIAAAFNMPLAGVVFAMEVMAIEYTMAGFIPIILAGVSASAIYQIVFGSDPIFIAPDFGLRSLGELFNIVLLGIIMGILASLFVHLLAFFTTYSKKYPIRQRMLVVGIVTGVLALLVPEIMGVGYGTVNAALMGNLGLELMLAIVFCKLLATTLGLGLGLPGGLIGPLLVIGSAAGGVLGTLFYAYAEEGTWHTFYAMLGMGAMMGAALNAPLAALTALLEMTGNHNVIMPGMLVIVTATLTSNIGFRNPSVFVKLLQAQGLSYRSDPITQFLRGLGVTGTMDGKVQEAPRQVTRKQLDELLATPSTWLLVHGEGDGSKILFTADLVRYLEKAPEEEALDLFELPVHVLDAESISAQATLLGALQQMDKKGLDALYVMQPRNRRIVGVITRKGIERTYRYQAN